MDKVRIILTKGYFPVQLPPAFTTTNFAIQHDYLTSAWQGRKSPRCRVEPFSVARSSYHRRITSLVNPVPYLFLVNEVAKYWGKIQNHYSKGRVSLSRPKLKSGLRSIEISKFSELHEEKILRSSGYRFALLTDISSFFPTIYTHTIPWALHGKENAKNNKQKTPGFFGNILDACSMAVQDFQTLGLPIGPDTSHIIAEILAVSIDVELKNKIGKWPAGFRYVDDFCYFFESREEAESALTHLARIVSSFELRLNPTKTKIVEVKELVKESWKYSLKRLQISNEIKPQRDDIHQFFGQIFALESRFGDESLVKYGLKIISSKIIKKQNWNTFQAYLMKCGYSFPNTLQVITAILTTYKYHGYNLDNKAIHRFANSIIKQHSILDGHSEVAWALWILKELELPLDQDAFDIVMENTSSVCVLLAISLLKTTKLKQVLRSGALDKFGSKKELYGDNWLLAYEAGKAGWIRNGDQNYIQTDNFFSSILDKGISFYDKAARLKPIFDLKDVSEMYIDWFSTDFDINDKFEFDDDDDEYFDSDEANDEETEEDNDEDEYEDDTGFDF